METGAGAAREEAGMDALESLLGGAMTTGLVGLRILGACFFKSGGDCFFSSSTGFSAKVTPLLSETGCEWLLDCELTDSMESERSRCDCCCFFAEEAALGNGESSAKAAVADWDALVASSSDSRRGFSLLRALAFAVAVEAASI